MKLYVANCTKQHHLFTYRVPEGRRNVEQRIDVGQCAQVWQDANRADLEAIVAQHARYGLVEVREIDRTKGFIGMCYSYDAPINPDAVMRALEHNDAVLVQRGADLRKQAAVAIAVGVEQSAQEAGASLSGTETTVQEVDAKNGMDTRINETIAVGGRPGKRRK